MTYMALSFLNRNESFSVEEDSKVERYTKWQFFLTYSLQIINMPF